ncbi:LytTR family DNA-binding domain-containing protein [Prolixibacter sp. NT017]|uniref:LytR/AlgR family response regulator transcription factor n=1 Tax=Prolixibacter sp. NT017 TaxID=2652390 RepID=UPI0012885B98|nr:LytTR family DNA-binding domain-containing protein [Prolixibacter sp. NT017]GET25998.1 DNA-binding response regulator [Prolixibacter sp. NT017]
MLKLRCVITDDEPMARKGLQGYIEKLGFLELVATCQDAVQLGNVLKEQPVDLIFLDIEMPYLSGVDFLSGIHHPPKVIIVSAYEQYALKGYELDVADYLLKPVSFERFLKAVNKVYDQFEKENTDQLQSGSIFVKTSQKYEKVNFDDILFVEGMENYISIQTAENRLVAHSKLSAFIEKLPPRNFVQIHKSFVVNIDKVTSLEGNQLGIGSYKLPVSRNYSAQIREMLLRQ